MRILFVLNFTSLILHLLIAPRVFGVGSSNKVSCHDKATVSEILDGKKKESKLSFCISLEPYFVMSKSCLSGGACAARAAAMSPGVSPKNFLSSAGNPTFLFCKSRGGLPKTIQIFVPQKREISICQFPDGSFLNVEHFSQLSVLGGTSAPSETKQKEKGS